MLISPFIQISGRWHVVINWEPGMEPGKILEVRPLNEQESDWLVPNLEDAMMEVWARLFPTDESIQYGAEPPEEE